MGEGGEGFRFGGGILLRTKGEGGIYTEKESERAKGAGVI